MKKFNDESLSLTLRSHIMNILEKQPVRSNIGEILEDDEMIDTLNATHDILVDAYVDEKVENLYKALMMRTTEVQDKFEYTFQSFSSSSVEDFQDLMNGMGNKGWEFCTGQIKNEGFSGEVGWYKLEMGMFKRKII